MNARPDDKLAALCEIAELTMRHMNRSKDVPPAESFLLGMIAGTAMRVPGVNQYLKEQEAAAKAGREAGQGFSRTWPPGVHGPEIQEG